MRISFNTGAPACTVLANEVVRSVGAMPDTGVGQAAHHWRLRSLREKAELSGTHRVPSRMPIHSLMLLGMTMYFQNMGQQLFVPKHCLLLASKRTRMSEQFVYTILSSKLITKH